MDQQLQRRRLVIFPCPLQGHINPMLQLVSILHSHSKGALSITIVHAQFNSPNPSNYPDFNFLSITDGLSQSEIESSTKDVSAFLTILNHKCVEPFRDCLVNKILSQKHEPPVACLISDATMHFTQLVADSLQLPRIVLRTSSPMSFVGFAAFPDLRQKGYVPVRESELEAPVPEIPHLKLKDLPVIKSYNSEVFFQLAADMTNQTKASSGLIVNTFESLDKLALELLNKTFAVPIFAVGPFHKFSSASSSSSLMTPDQTCISWLNKQAPSSVVYVSFGSIASISKSQIGGDSYGTCQ
ncbi:hypothetical protein IFM89_022180 [Coptis chinensis]|uniref:Uncharacterized protein n=1 Tax=Coptis chinensis TaxID=261450 RepID=A0A835H001_9MAGN|nr:hypothetical protein IFM89_022180 [Coptis chinensis]